MGLFLSENEKKTLLVILVYLYNKEVKILSSDFLRKLQINVSYNVEAANAKLILFKNC